LTSAQAKGAPLPTDGKVVIVGASLAGWRAAENLRVEGFSGQIALIGAEPHPPYDRPPLSKQVLAGSWPPERAQLATPEKLEALGIESYFGRRACELDVEGRRVKLDDDSWIAGDAVVVATGGRARHLGGIAHHEGVGVLRSFDDAMELRERVLSVGPGCRVVVIGAGFIGSEVASTCRELECEVHVIEALKTPLSNALGEQVGAACASLHLSHDVDLRTGISIKALHRPGISPPGVVTSGEGKAGTSWWWGSV
jgi:NADPH-dependent 2,4-dienoyl-CoA reductase/sulfur reductase-like enzyme